MANSADLDQLASSEAKWTGSTLFVKTGYIRVQQGTRVYKTIHYKMVLDIRYCIWPNYLTLHLGFFKNTGKNLC